MRSPTINIVIDKEWDKEVIALFIDEKDNHYDFGYERIGKLHPELAALRGKPNDGKTRIIDDYVERYYTEHLQEIEDARLMMTKMWTSIEDKYFVELAKIFGRLDFYPKYEIKAALSIAAAGVIGDDNASFQIWYKTANDPREVCRHFAHEILHFYYFSYLKKNGLVELSKDWDLSEIFNVIILGLPQFVIITGKADQGYEQHEKYFAHYRNLWSESKNLNEYLMRTEVERFPPIVNRIEKL